MALEAFEQRFVEKERVETAVVVGREGQEERKRRGRRGGVGRWEGRKSSKLQNY